MSHRQPKLKMSRVIGVFFNLYANVQRVVKWRIYCWHLLFTLVLEVFLDFSLLLIFLRRRELRESREAARKEWIISYILHRKTSSYFVLESHLHADARIRIWPSGSDWLIVYHYFSHIFCLTYITWLFFVLVKRRPREISFFSYQHGLQYSSWRGGFTSFRFI